MKRRETFRQRLGRIEIGEMEMEEQWRILEGRVRKALRDTKRELDKRKDRNGRWWDVECERKKRQVRKELRDWRRIGTDGIKYRKTRQKYSR